MEINGNINLSERLVSLAAGVGKVWCGINLKQRIQSIEPSTRALWATMPPLFVCFRDVFPLTSPSWKLVIFPRPSKLYLWFEIKLYTTKQLNLTSLQSLFLTMIFTSNYPSHYRIKLMFKVQLFFFWNVMWPVSNTADAFRRFNPIVRRTLITRVKPSYVQTIR